MAFDTQLVDRVRSYLAAVPGLEIEEKKMFSGLAFLVNGKMCVNISHDRLMCRFDPKRHEEVAERPGFRPMVMKGKEMNGYCYVEPEAIRTPSILHHWIQTCLDFNKEAKASRRKK
ncbi:MAG: TfoX family protein [Chitinophagaceae bacterium]|nr:MAG: TfoX family protein [Chitinophagaceae bacterium]